MKTKSLLISILLTCFILQAKGNMYQETMKKNIALMDSAVETANLSDLINTANSYERISAMESAEWLPSYYAAYCYVIANYFIESKEERDQYIDKAESLIDIATKRTSSDNVEVIILKAYIIQARSNVNPASRARKTAPIVEEHLRRAFDLDPDNPRYYYMRGENMFYTPKMFGGGKDLAKSLFETALEKYAAFELESDIHPSWGMERTQYLLAECVEEK